MSSQPTFVRGAIHIKPSEYRHTGQRGRSRMLVDSAYVGKDSVAFACTIDNLLDELQNNLDLDCRLENPSLNPDVMIKGTTILFGMSTNWKGLLLKPYVRVDDLIDCLLVNIGDIFHQSTQGLFQYLNTFELKIDVSQTVNAVEMSESVAQLLMISSPEFELRDEYEIPNSRWYKNGKETLNRINSLELRFTPLSIPTADKIKS